jgi:outer membrane protein with beta-barrel domain
LRSRFSTVVILCVGVVMPVQMVRAQEVAAYFGLGSAYDSSNGNQIDTFGDGTLHKTPHLIGLFAELGASVFFNKHVGVGAELAWRPSEGDYAGLLYRPSFASFDAIYRPSMGSTKRFVPELRGGIGWARVRYDFNDQGSCDQVPGCPDTTHFQVHMGAATRWYVSDHLYLRPALDVHYVHNLFEFGSNWVPRYSVGIGYSFGR